MAITKVKTGWQVNIQPGGRGGKRVKKTFPSKAEALAWERHVRAKNQENPDWLPPKKDPRKLNELIDAWYELHGVGLTSGEDTLARLKKMCEALENPAASSFSAEKFADYRKKRLETGVSQSTLNREHSYLRSVFNELIRLGHWKRENPLKNVRQFKMQQVELSYLTASQVKTLFAELEKSPNPHVLIIAQICLATGARWSEAENLQSQHVTSTGIQFVNTKGKRTRTIPIPQELDADLLEHKKTHHTEKKDGARFSLFEPSYNAFRYAIQQAEIELPDGQLTHILRHTYASHFMMGGGNILTLQRILGHQSITMTMRYAHLAPDHLEESRRLNPFSAVLKNKGA
ncbi:MAG: integrase [Oxalobacter sp.]|nr:MAG: integrase [Oxalobacter sp.]